MKAGNILLTLLLLSVLIAPAMAASITGCEVTGTNVYAGSTAYNIGPAAEIDSTSTATGITNTAGRYIYASGLSYTQAAGIVTYTIENRQGAAVTATEQGTETGMYWDYGDGNTATTDSLTHRYNTPSTYTTNLQLTSYLQETPVSVSTAVTLATSGVTDCTVTDTNVYAGSRLYDITPSAYLKDGNTAAGITNVNGRYLYVENLAATVSGSTATITAEGRQGAAVNTTTQGTTGTYAWEFGDGTTATTTATDTTTHTYSTGIYSAKVDIPGYFGDLTLYTNPINVGVSTYSAEEITTQDFDIVVETGQLYQPQIQYILPSANADTEFFAGNVFVLVSGQTVYTIDAATDTATPVSTTTGTTAETIYIGEYATIITDTAGNTAVYEYPENTFSYLASGGSSLIATTQNYAGIVLDGKLNLYSLTTNKKIGDITTTVTGFSGNDYGDTFAGYNGANLTYYWVENGQIKSATETLPHTITGIQQISQTENYIVTTQANTYIISVSAIGEYNLVTTSETDTPLTHPQATTIGVTIGVHAPNEIYILGADGTTAGTYQTGSTLADTSITKATGLYAISGGSDQQAYILRKDQESTWSLAQIVKANAALTHTQVSTTGTWAAVISGTNLYVLKLSTTQDASYYLQGVVVGSSGEVYANKPITINGEKVTTDLSGKFTYPVTPGMVYEIVAETTRTEYTATNAALQSIAIRLNPNPYAQTVSYSTDYNAETGQFEMLYMDSKALTESVTWVIRETGSQEIVSQQTVPAGQTAYWEVPFDKVFTSYQITMIADRQGTNVENVWILTPDGKNPIDIPGLDDTGKTIIFGAVLMIFGGLFGVMHSAKGALLTVALAGIMTYLGLLAIPWPVIMIAGTIAVIAILAGGQR